METTHTHYREQSLDVIKGEIKGGRTSIYYLKKDINYVLLIGWVGFWFHVVIDDMLEEHVKLLEGFVQSTVEPSESIK